MTEKELGYDKTKLTVEIFSRSGEAAVRKLYDNMLHERNNKLPEDFRTSKEYDDHTDFLDGSIDYLEEYFNKLENK